ncbi:MAG TPA: MarR family EPS-associated transcriptional regulator [Desulfobacter sp.]|nr:MarR family EPS-associated transcriptional regulator [Desulfobacter sp.]
MRLSPFPYIMQESIRYHILKQIQDNPEITQRELARVAGVSLGKINYCLRALADKGLIKAERFRQNPHKGRYLYALTPKGLEEKTRVTSRFLRKKLQEYDALKEEIERLREETGKDPESELG